MMDVPARLTVSPEELGGQCVGPIQEGRKFGWPSAPDPRRFCQLFPTIGKVAMTASYHRVPALPGAGPGLGAGLKRLSAGAG